LSILAHSIQVERDGFSNLRFNVSHSPARCNTPRKVWHVSGIVTLGFFDDDCVTHITLAT